MRAIPAKPEPRRGPSKESRSLSTAFGMAAPSFTSPGLIEKIRQQGHEEFAPRARRALENHKIEWRRTTVAGVSCVEAKPRGRDCSRTLLFYFGGGYVYGSAYDDLCLSAVLSYHTGARIIAPEYPLAPEHPYPAAIDQGFAVYQQLVNNVAIDSFAIAGESAGANLAMALMLRARDAGIALPNAAALLSPWCDLTLVESQQMKTPFAHAYAGNRDRHDPYISPLFGSFQNGFPRTMITTGTRDVLFYQCLRLGRSMIAAGVQVDLRVWEGLWHVFECYDELPEAAESLAEISDFLFRTQ